MTPSYSFLLIVVEVRYKNFLFGLLAILAVFAYDLAA